jgi:hypothetical protein
LTQGKWAKIDLADLPMVMFNCWLRDRLGYAYRVGPRKQKILMHRVIMGLPPGRVPEVDHKNGNPLDNRRSNLRIATRSQQGANQRTSRRLYGLKGVHWDKEARKWKVEIRINGKLRNLGRFALGDEVEAARAYDRAAVEAWGEFALINGV